MLTLPSRSNGWPGLFTPVSLSPRIAYVFGSRMSPGAGDADGSADGDGNPTGPALTFGAGMGLLDGGALCGVMITGAGEPLGDGDALGTGGGVTAPGDGVGGCGTRICGPCGDTGGPTYGCGVGDGEGVAVGADVAAAATAEP